MAQPTYVLGGMAGSNALYCTFLLARYRKSKSSLLYMYYQAFFGMVAFYT